MLLAGFAMRGSGDVESCGFRSAPAILFVCAGWRQWRRGSYRRRRRRGMSWTFGCWFFCRRWSISLQSPFLLVAQVALDNLVSMLAVVPPVLFPALAGGAAIPLPGRVGAECFSAPLTGALERTCGGWGGGAGVVHRLASQSASVRLALPCGVLGKP